MSHTLTIGPITIPVPALKWAPISHPLFAAKSFDSGEWIATENDSGSGQLCRKDEEGYPEFAGNFDSLEAAQRYAAEIEARERLNAASPELLAVCLGILNEVSFPDTPKSVEGYKEWHITGKCDAPGGLLDRLRKAVDLAGGAAPPVEESRVRWQDFRESVTSVAEGRVGSVLKYAIHPYGGTYRLWARRPGTDSLTVFVRDGSIADLKAAAEQLEAAANH